MRIKTLLLGIILICLLVNIGYGSSKEVLEKYNCTVIKTDSLHTFKKSYEIQIPHQLTEDQLREIATTIIKENPQYVRIFIGYRLPNFVPNSIYWATSHYTPELKIEILDLTKDEETILKNSSTPNGKIIGKWLDNSFGDHNLTIIYKKNDKYIMKLTYKDGGSREKNLSHSLSNDKTKFTYKNSFGEYLLIENDGRLGYYDDDGLFLTLEKIE